MREERGTILFCDVAKKCGFIDEHVVTVVAAAASNATTAHSLAADKVSHHLFVPIGYVPTNATAGTDPTLR